MHIQTLLACCITMYIWELHDMLAVHILQQMFYCHIQDIIKISLQFTMIF